MDPGNKALHLIPLKEYIGDVEPKLLELIKL